MNERNSTLSCVFCAVICILMLAAASLSHAATVWTGPLITYNQPTPDPTQESNQDRITPDVWLTRAASKGLFNAFYETSATALSPTNTEWAFGALTNYSSLHYTNWLAMLNGQSPTTLVGQQLVVHLISDDIYISVQFTLWNSMNTGGFAYERSTPPVPIIWNGPFINYSQPTPDPTQASNQDRITPDVWLTRGTSQGLFNAAEETSFTHFLSPTNTEWADGTTENYSNLTYTDWNTWNQSHGGPPGTVGVDAVVHLISDNIYIDIQFTSWTEMGGGFAYQRSTPPPPEISVTGVANGQFSFNYTADAGFAYVVQSSTNLVDWVSLTTNIASDDLVLFSNALNSTGAKFYRVGRMPNP